VVNLELAVGGNTMGSPEANLPNRALTQIRLATTLASSHTEIQLSVGSGIEVVVSKSVQPIRTISIENHADRISENPTGFQTQSK
jgi:hypothetical protein